MTTLPAVPGVLKLRHIYADGADYSLTNNLHFAYTGGPPSSADCTAIATAAHAAWASHLRSHLNTGSYLATTYVQDLASLSGADGLYEAITNGSGSSEVMPAGVAVLINHKIARRYRGGKPRSYLPFFGANDNSEDGLWLGTSISALQSDWNAYIAAIKAITAGATVISRFVNVSYYAGSVGSVIDSGKRGKTTLTLRAAPVVDEIISSLVNQHPSSQRRRNKR